MDAEEIFNRIGLVLFYVLGIGMAILFWNSMDTQNAGANGFFVNPFNKIKLPEMTSMFNQNSQARPEPAQQKQVVAISKIPNSYPVKGNFRISSGFGYRSDPFHGRRTFHRGIDIPLRTGTPVYATGRGKVIEARFHRGMGNYIKIRHADGYESIYAHLSRIHVRRGQVVESGRHIANSGNTGRSTGPHLHYQVNLNGRAIDPEELVNRLNTVQNN